MHRLRTLSLIILLAMISGAGAHSQDVTSPTKHFEKGGVTFDYPADWTTTEDNSPNLQNVTVLPASGATQIVVSIYSGPVLTCDFDSESKKIASVFVKSVAKVIKAGAE